MQGGVISLPLSGVEQCVLRPAELIEKPIGGFRPGTGLKCAKIRESLSCSMPDNFGIGLSTVDPQQPVMIRRLVLRRNAKPFVIGIEFVAHDKVASERCRFLAVRLRSIDL